MELAVHRHGPPLDVGATRPAGRPHGTPAHRQVLDLAGQEPAALSQPTAKQDGPCRRRLDPQHLRGGLDVEHSGAGGAAGGAVVWIPTPAMSWQWQLTGTIDQSVTAQMFDVDLFDTPATTVASLHAGRPPRGLLRQRRNLRELASRRVVVSGGGQGQRRPGWPDEQWLDVRQWSVLQPILEARMDLCRSKGFDGDRADNVDGYSNRTGFPLTAADQLAFNRALASSAHARSFPSG